MSKPRRPKNIAAYETVESATKGLEGLAADLRRRAAPGDMLRWEINLHFWNENWLTPVQPRPEHDEIVDTAALPSGREPQN